MILNKIIERRLEQLTEEKKQLSQSEIVALARTMPESIHDFREVIKKEGMSIIAEIKKASPSKGIICENFNPVEIAKCYEKGGASAISVLTENHYFMGSSEVLRAVRNTVEIPILRKDFIVDEYQIYESKVIGADAILLIVAILDEVQLKMYAALAKSLGLVSLTEVHNERELEIALNAGCEIIGINNRDLKTFEVDLLVTKHLASKIPKNHLIISESGIHGKEDLQRIHEWHVDGALVGEYLMRSSDVFGSLRNMKEVGAKCL